MSDFTTTLRNGPIRSQTAQEPSENKYINKTKLEDSTVYCQAEKWKQSYVKIKGQCHKIIVMG